MVVHTDSERVRLSRALVLELLASSVDLSTAPAVQDYMERYDARPERFGPPAAPAPAGERDDAVRRPPPCAGRAAPPPSRQPVKVDNDLYVRDYGEVHPLLQVRRGLRHRRAEHLRHRRRRPRLRRAHLHRVRGAAARLGLRLLRQLHRRLPDRRPDVQERARHAAGGHLGREPADADRHRSAPTAAWAAPSPSTCRTTRSSRSPRRSTTTSPAATSASRAASAGSSCRTATSLISALQGPAHRFWEQRLTAGDCSPVRTG